MEDSRMESNTRPTGLWLQGLGQNTSGDCKLPLALEPTFQ